MHFIIEPFIVTPHKRSMSFTVTPLDVVKTRLQTQQKRMTSNKCFVYCNGLMDHLCPCPNGEFKSLKTQSTHYNGMIVRMPFDGVYIDEKQGWVTFWMHSPCLETKWNIQKKKSIVKIIVRKSNILCVYKSKQIGCFFQNWTIWRNGIAIFWLKSNTNFSYPGNYVLLRIVRRHKTFYERFLLEK